MTERDNLGSAARDQLANERTFLAWVRTALGLIGLGVVMAKLLEDPTLALVGGLSFVAWGAGILVYSIVRYRTVTELLERGKYRPARGGPLIIVGTGLPVVIVAVVVLLMTAR